MTNEFSTWRKRRHTIITDHAVLHYLERVKGCDLGRLRRRIPNESQLLNYLIRKGRADIGLLYAEMGIEKLEKAVRLGARRVFKDDAVFVVDDNLIVTTLRRDTMMDKCSLRIADKKPRGRSTVRREAIRSSW